MICVKLNFMPIKTTNKFYSAKTVVPANVLKDIRRWLIDNCKNRWSATNYKGEDFNWRKLSKVDKLNELLYALDVTIIVNFKKSEDLMLYLLSWPSDVLLDD